MKRSLASSLSAVIALVPLSLLAPRNACAVTVTDGLIHLWHLDETNGTTARDSVGAWDLQLVGGATLGAPAVNGTGVLLDGRNDYLMSAPVAAEFIASDFTLSLWLHWLSAPGKPGLLEFSSDEWFRHVSIDLSYGDIRPFLDTSSGTLGVWSSKSIADNQWHLLSVVREGNAAFMYLDAVLVGSGMGDLKFTGTTATFRLGQYGGTHLFGGVLDEVAIYNRALSSSEVAANTIPEPHEAALLALSGVLVATRYRRPARA